MSKWIPIADIGRLTKVKMNTVRMHVRTGHCPSKRKNGRVYIPEEWAKKYITIAYDKLKLRTIAELAEECGKDRCNFLPSRNKHLMTDIVIKIGRNHYLKQEDFDRIVWINHNTVTTTEAGKQFERTGTCIYGWTKRGLPYYKYGKDRRVAICQIKMFLYAERCRNLGIDPTDLVAFRFNIDDDWKKYVTIEQ